MSFVGCVWKATQAITTLYITLEVVLEWGSVISIDNLKLLNVRRNAGITNSLSYYGMFYPVSWGS